MKCTFFTATPNTDVKNQSIWQLKNGYSITISNSIFLIFGEGTSYPLQYSGLEHSLDWTVHGVAKSWTRVSDFHFHFFPDISGICSIHLVNSCIFFAQFSSGYFKEGNGTPLQYSCLENPMVGGAW